MLEVVLILLLAAHLLCVNLASGGPIVAAWLDWRGAGGDPAAAKAARFLAAGALGGLLAGAALGVAIGWLKWNAEYRAIWLGLLSYKLRWGILEAVFSLVLLVAWWWWLPGREGGPRWAAAARACLAILSATNLLYHFPLLFSVASRLESSGVISDVPLRGRGFLALAQGETLALTTHVVLASIAVAGMTLLVFALQCLARGEEARARRIGRWGGWWALAPSLLQLPVGLWLLSVLPSVEQTRLMGAGAMAVVLFVGGVAAALWLINDLAHLSLGEFRRGLVARAIVALGLTVLLMTAMQTVARDRPPSRTHDSPVGALP